jgi:hypothetical protein
MPVFMIGPIPGPGHDPMTMDGFFQVQHIHEPYHIESLRRILQITEKYTVNILLLRSGTHRLTLRPMGNTVNSL